MVYELTISMILLVTKVVTGVDIIQDTPACCGTTATFRCRVVGSTTLFWAVGSFPSVEFFSNSPLNTPVRRGENDKFEFVLDDVQPNPDNPTFLSDFNSTLTVDINDDLLDGTQIQCDDLTATATETLTLVTTQEAINDDGMCDCPEGGGNVTATWSVPELCGWENVVPTVSLTCLTCQDTDPAALDLSLPVLTSSQQISFVVPQLEAENYRIEISVTNDCDDTTIRSCEAMCSRNSRSISTGIIIVICVLLVLAVLVVVVVVIVTIGVITKHKKSSLVGAALLKMGTNKAENVETGEKEAEEKARKEAEEKARKEAEEKARKEAEEKAKKEAEER